MFTKDELLFLKKVLIGQKKSLDKFRLFAGSDSFCDIYDSVLILLDKIDVLLSE